jgi:hypothetical protein
MPAQTQRFFALACALIGIVLLSGCSSFQIAYSFAGSMVESRAEDYLDLSPEQETELETHSAALIAWHRKTMLAKYATFFNFHADIAEAGGWTRGQMKEAFAEFRALLDETAEGASPFIAKVLVGHTTPEKLAYLEDRLAESMAERRAKEATEAREDVADEWVERRVERLSRFTGTLRDEQIAMIRRHTEGGMDLAMRWLDNRELRQGALVTFLRAEPSQAQVAHFVHRILLHAHEIVDPGYRAISEARWALLEEMYFDVLTSLSDDQRRELVSTLRSYAEDMIDLAGAQGT